MNSDADLSAYAEQRVKRISEAHAEFRKRGVIARADILAEDAAPGSADEVGAVLFELRAVIADETIVRYDNPTDDALLDVLALAEVYEGDWYHSYVSLVSIDGWTPVQQRIVDLPSSSGVFRLYSYEGTFSPERL